MKARLKRIVRRALYKYAETVGLEKQLVLSGQIRAAQVQQSGRLNALAEAEFSAFSQWGEDGIIEFLVATLEGIPQRFVEFGVEDFREANCRFLALNRNWSGLLMDGSPVHRDSFRRSSISYKHDIQFVNAFITAENIQSLLNANGFGKDLGILSVDIDGVDYWVLEKVTTQADIVIVEYNAFLDPQPVSVPYDPAFVRAEKHPSGMYWGASLAAFRHLLQGQGYVFAGTNAVGTNAFFVREKHKAALEKRVVMGVSFPCKMREVSNLDGSLAYKTYAECGSWIDALDVVDVTTGRQHKIAERGA